MKYRIGFASFCCKVLGYFVLFFTQVAHQEEKSGGNDSLEMQ